MSQSGQYLGQIADRYASALFDLARDTNALDTVEHDLARIAGLIAQDKNMSDLVRSPVLAREVQARAVGAILVKLGVHDLTRKFVLLLAEKRRLFVLPTINHAFGALLANLRGEMTAEVTSAQPLKDAQIVALKGVLKDTYKREVRLETKVDPALIGGFVLKAASRQIDTSIRSKLKALESAMKGS